MKRLLQLSLIAVLITFMSCKKEEQILQQETNNGKTNIVGKSKKPTKFRKEIVVTDKAGVNSVFIAVTSDYESAINEYLDNIDISLVIEDESIINEIKESSNINKNTKSSEKEPKIEKEHSVNVEIVSVNFENPQSTFALNIKSKENMNKSFITGTYASYSDYSDFMGIVHRGNGYNLWVTTNYKQNWYNSWTNVYQGFLYPHGVYYAYVEKEHSLKTSIGVYMDARQGSINYHIAISHNDFRGHHCKIGSYDYNNYGECFLGTSPAGTSPFFWTSPHTGITGQYYSALPGNNCPYSGSTFDGAHCFVKNIPTGCETYTWWRSWLIKSDKIL